MEAIGASVGDWPAFDDSAEALARLHERYKLAPITNCDDDLFALSAKRLGVDFDWVITAEQARSYKPSARNFELAFATIDAPRERILHVAQSLFHDHVTAKRARHDDGVDRPPPGTRGLGRHAAGRGGARPHAAGHALAGRSRRRLEQPGDQQDDQRDARGRRR